MSGLERDFTDPVGVLRDGHRRIEASLAAFLRLTEAAGTLLSADGRESLQSALRCFGETPQHMADEEESLFPHLRAQHDSRVLPVLARLESLEEEHVCSDRIHAELDALGQAWLRQGTLPSPAASRMSTLAAQLRDVYRHHIAVEEDEVFPIAAAILSRAAMEAIGREMLCRRGTPRQAD